jgi:hypothetical protein
MQRHPIPLIPMMMTPEDGYEPLFLRVHLQSLIMRLQLANEQLIELLRRSERKILLI